MRAVRTQATPAAGLRGGSPATNPPRPGGPSRWRTVRLFCARSRSCVRARQLVAGWLTRCARAHNAQSKSVAQSTTPSITRCGQQAARRQALPIRSRIAPSGRGHRDLVTSQRLAGSRPTDPGVTHPSPPLVRGGTFARAIAVVVVSAAASAELSRAERWAGLCSAPRVRATQPPSPAAPTLLDSRRPPAYSLAARNAPQAPNQVVLKSEVLSPLVGVQVYIESFGICRPQLIHPVCGINIAPRPLFHGCPPLELREEAAAARQSPGAPQYVLAPAARRARQRGGVRH